jgi:hypothetical protein
MKGCAIALLAALAAVAAHADEPLHVFVHFPEHAPQSLDRAIILGGVLSADGFDVVDLRPVTVTTRQPTIRYFEPELRKEALRLRDEVVKILRKQGVGQLLVRVQDFTFYRPKPRPNAVELWFAR